MRYFHLVLPLFVWQTLLVFEADTKGSEWTGRLVCASELGLWCAEWAGIDALPGSAHSGPLSQVSPENPTGSVAPLRSSDAVLMIPGLTGLIISCGSRVSHVASVPRTAKKPLDGVLAEAICNSLRRTSFYITKHYFQDLILSLLFVFCKDCLVQKVKISAKHRQIFAE